MRSMTGYGVGEAKLTDNGRITVEIRGVNHRFLDVRVRVPSQLPDLAPPAEGLARERLSRGRFDVSVRVDGAAAFAMTIDRDRARSVFAELRALRDELCPNEEVPLSLLASVPDLFVPTLEQHADEVRAALTVAFDAAVAELDAMRIREGLALAEDLGKRLRTVRALSRVIAERAPFVLEGYKKRLKDRADKLRVSSDLDVDSGRLEQELAFFADKVDVAEELTRLESHASHFESMLLATGSVGRRLDFLLQEMAREANTIGAKCQDAPTAQTVVELKAEIERIREQVQNIE